VNRGHDAGEHYPVHANGQTSPGRSKSGAAAWQPTVRVDGWLGLRRVAALVQSLAANTSISRWEYWVHRLLARHGAAHGRWDWMATVLVRPRLAPRTTLRPVHWTIALTVHARTPVPSQSMPAGGAVTASLAALRPAPASLGAATVPPSLRALRWRARSETPARRAAVVHVQERRSVHTDLMQRYSRAVSRERELVERLLARRERREHPETSSAPPFLAPLGIPRPTVGSVPGSDAVVVRRQPTVGARHAVPTPLPAFTPSLVETGAPAKPAAPAIDVQALADQVIRTIDQRVIAARERLGAT
jgi:hypothetical protein